MAKSYTIGKNNKFPLSKSDIIKNLFDPEFLQFNSWVFLADYENAKIKAFEDEYSPFIWTEGRWYGGTWKGGRWYGGTWKGGTWRNGTWRGGAWEGGTWENGTWQDGVWNRGTWEGGNWIKGKILDGNKLVDSKVSPAEYFSDK